jgi:carbon-monoxide dehydrogenase medium subunit
MLLREIEYVRPTTVAAALGFLGGHDNARALAGGQTLVNVMKLRIAGPDLVVDITRIPELRGIRTLADGSLEIGAVTTYAEINESADVRERRPIVAEVASIIADVQVRNRGTIGGNVCLNLGTSHYPCVLAVLEASFTIAGQDGERTVAADQFFVSAFETAVRPGELLTEIRIPPAAGHCDAFVAMAAGKESQSIVHVAVSLRIDDTIEAARIALGCVASRPVRARSVERALVGKPVEQAVVSAAVRGLGATLSPVSDVNATADFKRHVAEVLVERAVLEAAKRGSSRRAA